MSPPAVTLENATKYFYRHTKRRETALGHILSGFWRPRGTPVAAVDNVSAAIEVGETLGIIGANGSGKSTLLRLIAGIHQPDGGTVTVNGRAAYISGFGYGIQPKLTMRENIYILGTLMGHSRHVIRRSFDDIVAFSELDEFVDVRVEELSAGMIARLNFSAGTWFLKHGNPDILLLDEVSLGAAGGDLRFQQKTEGLIAEMVEGDVTALVVNHRPEDLYGYVDRVLWIHGGRLQMVGDPGSVLEAYTTSSQNER